MGFDVALDLTRAGRTIRARFATGAGITALVGPSGVGKSSVVAAIAGLLQPLSGHAVVGGETLYDSARGIDLPPEARRCGVVFQDRRLFPHLSVAANLRYGLRRAVPERRVLDMAELAAELAIAPLLGRRVRTLSGGEAQRVAIARALLAGPRVLLLDEPLVALDAALVTRVSALIARMRDEFALPVLLVSHSAEHVARLADHVVELESPISA